MAYSRFVLAPVLAWALVAGACSSTPNIPDDIHLDDSAIQPRPDASVEDTGSSDRDGSEPADTNPGDTNPANTNPGAPWNRYAYDVAAGTWSQLSLNQLFAGSNSPPTNNIREISYVSDFNKIIVFAPDANGTLIVYIQQDGTWIAPVPFATLFAGCDLTTIDSSMELSSPPTAATLVNTLVLVDDDNFCRWDYSAAGSKFASKGKLPVLALPAPPRGKDVEMWATSLFDRTKYPADPWTTVWVLTSMGNIHRFEGTTFKDSSAAADNPMFKGKAGAPDPLKIRAAYGDSKNNFLYFVGP